MSFDPKEVAKAEIGWWKSHHERRYDEVIEQMTIVYEKLYNLTREVAREIVMLRIEAAKEHDLAEEEGISVDESQRHWDKALEFMTQHFEMLNKALITKNVSIETQKAIFRTIEEFHKDPSDPEKIRAMQNMGYDPLKIERP